MQKAIKLRVKSHPNCKNLDNDQEDVTAHDALTARLLGLALANTPTSMLDPPLDKRNRQLGKPVKTLHYISIHEMALHAKKIKYVGATFMPNMPLKTIKFQSIASKTQPNQIQPDIL